MIAVTLVALLVLPLIALRGMTLARCYAALLTLALFAFLVSRRLLTFDARLAFIALSVLALAIFALFLARGRNVRWSANRAAVIAAIVYAVVIPVTSWKVDGDEGHYLLITESVLHDGDLDLANQYRDGNTASGRRDLVPFPDDPVGPHGERYSRHAPFLSLLMLPGYALGGLHGALAMIALFGVLLVRSTIRWMEDEGIPDESVRAVFPLFAFAPPVLFYATRMWPEVPAAFFFVEALRGVRAQRAKRWVPALIGLVLLKARFGLVAVGLILAGGRAKRIALAMLTIPLLIMYAYSVHSWRELIPLPAFHYVRGFFGLLADGMSGIAFQAPFYLCGLAAIIRWRQTPRGFRTGILASLLYIFYLLPRQEAFGNYAPPLRYIVFLLPVLALGAAWLWERLPRGAIAIFATWSVALAIYGIRYPWRLFHEANGENAIGEWLSTMYHADFSRLFPSFVRINDAAWVGGFVVIAVVVWIGVGGRGSGVGWPVALTALLIAAGFHAGREPGSRVEFEDAHVSRDGGRLVPRLGTPNRSAYRGGWLLEPGNAATFLARAGTHDLHFITGVGATIELAGRTYRIEPRDAYRSIAVMVPETGPVTLRCVSGAINVDRMELRE
ncbi:MAG: hypothetical protein ACJ74H_12940 [Thermoanaerobaculia bacterium]